VLGIPLRIHWSLWLIVGLLATQGAASGTGGAAAMGLWAALVFGSVLAHELGHAVVARRRGARVRSITLFALGGVTQADGLGDRPRDELALTAAGPAVSLALAAVAAALAVALGVPLLPVDMHSGAILAQLAWLNLLLGAFNLLPAFPMDGGRLLRAGLALRLGPDRATRIAATTGRVVAAGMVVGGLYLGSIWLAVIGVFVFAGASAEQRQAALVGAVAAATVGDATDRTVPLVRVGMPRHDALALAGDGPLLVLSTDGRLGVTTAERLAAAGHVLDEWIADFDVPTIDVDGPLADATRLLAQGRVALPVTAGGTVRGLLTPASLAGYLATTSARGV
jgi:Zn-dependent protease